MSGVVICAHCGKKIRGEHIVFDGSDHFCDVECATAFFGGDSGCVDILLDEAERLLWRN